MTHTLSDFVMAAGIVPGYLAPVSAEDVDGGSTFAPICGKRASWRYPTTDGHTLGSARRRS